MAFLKSIALQTQSVMSASKKQWVRFYAAEAGCAGGHCSSPAAEAVETAKVKRHVVQVSTTICRDEEIAPSCPGTRRR
jgi:hypothetical protein